MRQIKINLISVLAAILSNICLYAFMYMGHRIDWFAFIVSFGFTFATKIVTFICFINSKDDYFNAALFTKLFSFELWLPYKAITSASTFIVSKIKAYIDK